MAVVPFHFEVNLEVVRYQALTKLAELAGEYVAIKRLDSDKAQKILMQMTRIRLWARALDSEAFLTQQQKDKIMYALIELSGIYAFPSAPILSNVERPAILIGTGGSTVNITNNYDAGTPFQNSDIDIGTETVDSFATSLGSGVVWHYTVSNGTAQRSGIFTSTWLTTTVDSSESSTPDINASTDDLVLSADVSAGSVRLRATTASNNWSVVGRRYLINNG